MNLGRVWIPFWAVLVVFVYFETAQKFLTVRVNAYLDVGLEIHRPILTVVRIIEPMLDTCRLETTVKR